MRHEMVHIIGAGLAGSEAAWQLALRGIRVRLVEMRPFRKTEAHTTDYCAELVCSNSFGSEALHSASSILKNELSQLGSLVLETARLHRVPAGASLAVNRTEFAAAVTQRLMERPEIQMVREEQTEIPTDLPTIVATGPLTTPGLSQAIQRLVGSQSLYFYDAISPIVSTESLDLEKMYRASRYGKGEADFLNIPLTQDQYETLVDDLLTAEVVLPHDFEEEKYFEGCMPVEAIAACGRKTLAFGPLRPVGLVDPRTGKRPHAVIQLRAENRFRTAYNLVGFQTKMRYGEQQRVFRKLPGLENAEFLRLGSMHRNTYVDSPRCLERTLQVRGTPRVWIAGQLTGTEGYLESSATGLVAGINAAHCMLNRDPRVLPEETMLGALLSAITDPEKTAFQPMNANFGVLPPLSIPTRDKATRNAQYADRSAKALDALLTGSSQPENYTFERPFHEAQVRGGSSPLRQEPCGRTPP